MTLIVYRDAEHFKDRNFDLVDGVFFGHYQVNLFVFKVHPDGAPKAVLALRKVWFA